MGKAKDIFNGWSSYLLPDDPQDLELAKKRAAICASCPTASKGLHTAVLPDYSIKEIQGFYCDSKKGGCGCPLSPAVRSKNYKCPLGNW